MKHYLSILLCFVICLCFVSCDNKVTETTVNTDVSAVSEAPPEIIRNTSVVSNGKTVDLSVLSSTLAYSQISNIIDNYEEYLGTTITMSGLFNGIVSYGNKIYTCSINDATACCSLGFEFRLPNDEEPSGCNDGDIITVTGMLSSYTEDGTVYLELLDAAVTK